jgi:hypothetical protein
MRHLIFSISMPVLVLLLISCTRQEGENMQASDVQNGSLQVADQIIYDVIIKNPDPGDEWTEKCLVGLNRGELVDFIIDGIYKNRFRGVTEVRLGLEHFDGFGMHLGHNPLFKVRLVEQ